MPVRGPFVKMVVLCCPLISQPFLTSWAVRHNLERRGATMLAAYHTCLSQSGCHVRLPVISQPALMSVKCEPHRRHFFDPPPSLPTSAADAAGSRQSGCGMVPSHITASFVDSWSCYNNNAISNIRWIFYSILVCFTVHKITYLITIYVCMRNILFMSVMLVMIIIMLYFVIV